MPTLIVQAVLFDLDGTLVDSTASVERSWRQVAARMRRDPADIVGRYHGMPGELILRTVDPTLSEDRVRELSHALLAYETSDIGDVMALPGAWAAMTSLPPLRWAVVTSCSLPLATVRLRAAGLPTPATLVTADDVVRGKPDPEPFLAGARALGMRPEDCLVVEDAPAGVAAARAAGCAVLGLRTTSRALQAETVADLSAVSFSVLPDGIHVAY